MDNATRRQLLEQAKQVGYTGSILDVFQNPQVLDQFAQEQQVQQQAQVQQPQPQMQVEMPTPPATTPNYKVAQPRQSEAKPLVMSNTEVPIQIRKTGGKVNSCPTGYIWSAEQNRCIPMASVSGYIPQNYDPNTTLNKSLENSQKQGWDIPQIGMEVVGAINPALSRPLSAIGAVSDVVNKNPIGYAGNMMQLIPHPVTKIAGTALSLASATPVGAALNAMMTEKPVYHHQPLETPRQSLDRFAVPESTNQPVFVPKNTKKKFEDGGPKDPPKKSNQSTSFDDYMMEGLRPQSAIQESTYRSVPIIEQAKKEDVKGVTTKQKVQTAANKKKIAEEEKKEEIKKQLLDQGEIKPATEGTERLKNQFIYAMDQPLDAMGSLMQRGYVPQGNLNGNYETSSPMSSVIGAFNPVSAVMDVARVGRDLGEKETYTTLSGAGELGLHALGILPSVQLGKQLGKKVIKEAVYWGVEPLGYGVKQKLAQAPANLIKYGYHGLRGNATKVRLKTLESIMENNDKMGEAIVKGEPYKYEAFKDGIKTLYNPKGNYGYEREAQRRLDAWNTTWNKDQLFDTFTKIGENKYVLNAAKYGMNPRQLNSVVNDIEANKLNRLFKKNEISPEEYDASLKALTLKQGIDNPYKNESFENVKSAILKNPENFKDIESYNPVRKGGATSGYLKNEGYTDVLSDSDKFGVRGGFLYHKKSNPDGTIHLRAHDTWDFNPWAKRGQIRNVENENARKYNDKNVINILRNIDPIQMLGGKPYDIENNYIFDPVKREIIDSYKTGGKKCYTCNQSKLQVLYNKRNYKK